MEELYTSVREKVPEILVSVENGDMRSRFVPASVHAKLISQSQCNLARSIALSRSDTELFTALEGVPAKWIWEKTDSVMWLPAFERLKKAIEAPLDDLTSVLTALKVLLIDPLAENSFHGWASLVQLVQGLLTKEEILTEKDWETICLALRVLRRHPLLLNPRKITRNGSFTSIPLFVVDIASSSKVWMERIGRGAETSSPAEAEKLRTFLTQFGFGLESVSETLFSLNAVADSQASLITIPSIAEGAPEIEERVQKIIFSAPSVSAQVVRLVHACRLLSLEMLTVMKPRSLALYLATYPSLLVECCDLIRSSRLSCHLSEAAEDLIATVIRETSQSGDSVWESLQGWLVKTVKLALSPPFEPTRIHSLINLFGSKCVSLAGVSQSAVTSHFSPWLSEAIAFIQADKKHQDFSCRISLCRLLASVIENSGSLALAQQFKESGGFQALCDRIKKDLLILTETAIDELRSETDHISLLVSVRSALRLIEICFKALELSGVGGGSNASFLLEILTPIFCIVFHHPLSVSAGTVALSATLLGQLVSHDPVSVPRLVREGLVEKISKACESDIVLESPEATSSIAQCLATLCVHADGERALVKELQDPMCSRVIKAFGRVEISEIWICSSQMVDMHDFNPGSLVGNTLDELIRNRPHLRESVVHAVSEAASGLLGSSKNNLSLFSDVLNNACRLVEGMCATNAETRTAYLKTTGLESLLRAANMKLPLNFSHVVPSHGLCRLVKFFAQNEKGPNVAVWASLLAGQTKSLFESVQKQQQYGEVPVMDLLTQLSPLHLLLHAAAIAIKDAPLSVSPSSFEPLSEMLALLATPTIVHQTSGERKSVLAVIAILAESKTKSDEEKELRKRLRDERMHAECFFSVFGSSDCPVSPEAIEKELVRGLWMVVRGFMCQVARIANYPSAPKNTNRRTVPAQKVSVHARSAAHHLAVLAIELVSLELSNKLETVDLLCRLHVEDKHHMTRSLCLDVFYKLGGVDKLLQTLDVCCTALTSASASSGGSTMEAIQGILWWFERTTSLKRMHNAQLTFWLQRESDESEERNNGCFFDAVKLVSSLQHDFAKSFMSHWRKNECISKISSKAAASLLKAFTHVLEPNEKLLATEDAQEQRSSATCKEYVCSTSVLEVAKNIAYDFMERTLVLGSSSNTAPLATQTHIADVCVRLSHNRVLKLGSPSDENLVKQLQSLAAFDDDPEPAGRYRSGTVTLTGDELEERNAAELASVETDELIEEQAKSEESTVDFSVYNSRHIAGICLENFLAPDSSDSLRRIACTVIACILHARSKLVADIFDSFIPDFILLLEKITSAELDLPVWICPGAVVVEKLLNRSTFRNCKLHVLETFSKLVFRAKDADACEAILRVTSSCLTLLYRTGFPTERFDLGKALLALTRECRFETMQIMTLLSFQPPSTREVFPQIEELVSDLLQSAGEQGVKLEAVFAQVRTKLENSSVHIVPLLAQVLRGRVSWLQELSAAPDEGEEVKRIKIVQHSSPCFSKIVLVPLPDQQALSGSPEIFNKEKIAFLSAALLERVREQAQGLPKAHALEVEDIVYLILSVCDESKEPNLLLENATAASLIDPLCNWVDKTRTEWDMVSNKTSNLMAETNKFVNQILYLIFKFGDKKAFLASLSDFLRDNPAVTFGQVVLVFKSLSLLSGAESEAERIALKQWTLLNLEQNMSLGIMELLELLTRPVIPGITDSVFPRASNNRSSLPSEETTPLLSSSNAMAALIEAIESGTINGSSGNVGSINNHPLDNNILGEAPSNDETPQPSESQVLEVVRRTLSPLVPAQTISADDFINSASSGSNLSVFFSRPDLVSPPEWSFETSIAANHPLIARSHTGSHATEMADPSRDQSALADEEREFVEWLVECAPRLGDVITVTAETHSIEEEVFEEYEQVMGEIETSIVPEASGIAALAEAARRIGMTEQELVASTGIDPSVLRDLPEFMHAEVIREFIGPLFTSSDSLVADILARQGRQRRRMAQRPVRSIGQNLLAQLQARVGARIVPINNPNPSRLMDFLNMRNSNRVLVLDSFPPLPSSANGSVKLSHEKIEQICAFNDAMDATSSSGWSLPFAAIEVIMASVFAEEMKSKSCLENVLLNLSLQRSQRHFILSKFFDMIENVVNSGSCLGSIKVRGPESAKKATVIDRVLSLLFFLLTNVPQGADWVAASSAINRLVLLIDSVSNHKGVVDLLRILLVSKNAKEEIYKTLTNESLKILIQFLFSKRLGPGMDIVAALSDSEIHGEYIRSSVEDLARRFALKVRTDLDENIFASPETEKLLETVKLLRSFTDFNHVARISAFQEMQSLWQSLDAALKRFEQSSLLSDIRQVVPLIEVFFTSHAHNSTPPPTLPQPLVQRELSEPTESQLVRLCESHRKILNLILSDSPQLLFGSLEQIVTSCPWTLEFDNKRRYFREKLKKINEEGLGNAIKLSVRRSEVFMDSFYQLRHRSAEEMRGKLSVQFTGEEGVDAGGLVREWFGILAREIFNPNYALFRTAGGKASTFHPNPMSTVNPDHLSFFQFCGRIVGKAIFDDQRLDAYFTRSFYKHMLNSPVTWMDFEVEDPEYYRQLQWILSTDLSASSEGLSVSENLSFSLDLDEFGHIRSEELIPGGFAVPVTQENKKDFVRLVCEFKMTTSITPQVNSFMKGFHELIPADLIGSLFDDKELELLISGLPAINLSDLKANTEYVNYSQSSPQIQWFWNLLEEEFTQEQLAWLLQFVTGSTQVPLEGFKALVGMRGPQRFSIHKAYGSHRLPTAHTCFNQLDLPEYENPQQLKEKLLKAVTEAHEGFGFI